MTTLLMIQEKLFTLEIIKKINRKIIEKPNYFLMKTYISNLIPRIQSYSEKLDNLSLLTNQHWVCIDDVTNIKSVYIFRDNKELLVSTNGKVKKAKWEYLGNNSILIDLDDDSYLFKHGFFDDIVLALKIDSKEEYAFLVNESKYSEELNSIDKITLLLKQRYLMNPSTPIPSKKEDLIQTNQVTEYRWTLKTNKGLLEIISNKKAGYSIGDVVFLNEAAAPDGKYTYGWPSWMSFIVIENGRLKSV